MSATTAVARVGRNGYQLRAPDRDRYGRHRWGGERRGAENAGHGNVAQHSGGKNARHGKCDTKKMQRWKMRENVWMESRNNVDAAE